MTTKKKAAKGNSQATDAPTGISTAKDLKEYLFTIRDRMTEGVAAPINALSAMNYILNVPEITSLLNKENKELARDIWLRIKQSGVQLKNPPLLFSADEEAVAG
ncbi:MAG: hypothetical protein KDD55_01865 [Bdellovibrionales bacterium]|nr:hypothetical protein [Bdellovibrionales bacterium]